MPTHPEMPVQNTPASYLSLFDAGRFFFLRHDIEPGYAWFRRDELPNRKPHPFCADREYRCHWSAMVPSA